MSGGDSWASTEPSLNSTNEWMIDSGWMMTSICSGSQAEQPAGLDHLQRLVHQRGRIDGDLRPHAPGRVPQRLVDGDVGELGPAAAAEGPAAAGQDDALDGVRRAALDRLEDGAVFAIDRQQPARRGVPPGP